MNERIRTLREQSLGIKPFISPERALLVTEFFRSGKVQGVSPHISRALAFAYLLEHKEIFIGDGELIVGERGSSPKATPTYPEICCHTEVDLATLDTRPRMPYAVSEETKKAYRETVIPFWMGRTIREKIFAEMEPEWMDAFKSGIFTEFMEQRAPGHTVLDGKIYEKGFTDFIADIHRSMESLDFLGDPRAHDRLERLRAMEIAAQALVAYAQRHSEIAAARARTEKDPKRKKELARISEICARVPAYAPQTFWEALQYYWFCHLGVISELNGWDSFNPGRLDVHLYPFYKKEKEEGTLSEEEARELLQAFWIKFNNQPAPPKVGVTAEESSTYTDFALINTGGLLADGADATNELSYIILDVIEEMRLLQPSSMVQISRKTPDKFLMRALDIIRTGYGQPSIFNTDEIVQELVRQGKSVEDAREGGASGCVESGAFGKEAYILTGYFNLPKVLEVTLNGGRDPLTGVMVGAETGCDFSSFEELFSAFERQVRYFTEMKVRGNNIVERLYAKHLPVPFLSLLISDCIEKGMDYHEGGARYNTSYIQGVGLGTITDSLASLKYNVYDEGHLTLEAFRRALGRDFEGDEGLRQRLLNKTPKYGNDDDYADGLARRVFDAFFSTVDSRPNTRGGFYRINLLPTTVHIYFGKVTGATPDGRKAHQPLSEGISPVQGADRKGPTAVIKSVSAIDHVRTGGTLLNQKFTPQLLSDEKGIRSLLYLVRSHFSLDGHHIQFNVVTADMLRDAQEHPEKYRSLIVRVAGYSDYFVDLGRDLQDEIIRRTEHERF